MGTCFAPLIGTFLEGFLSGLTEISIDTFWWITLALNICLGTLDENILKKAGHDVSKKGGGWLVPYIYLKELKY